MGKTIAESILARASGRKDIKAGDFVTAKVDLHYVTEANLVKSHKKVIEAGLDRKSVV